MTPDELRAALVTLNITQAELGQMVGRGDRAARYWLAGDRGIPPYVEIAVNAALAKKSARKRQRVAHGMAANGRVVMSKAERRLRA